MRKVPRTSVSGHEAAARHGLNGRKSESFSILGRKEYCRPIQRPHHLGLCRAIYSHPGHVRVPLHDPRAYSLDMLGKLSGHTGHGQLLLGEGSEIVRERSTHDRIGHVKASTWSEAEIPRPQGRDVGGYPDHELDSVAPVPPCGPVQQCEVSPLRIHAPASGSPVESRQALVEIDLRQNDDVRSTKIPASLELREVGRRHFDPVETVVIEIGLFPYEIALRSKGPEVASEQAHLLVAATWRRAMRIEEEEPHPALL